MKKVFLLLTLIATTISAWGATTVYKKVSDLKTTYGWSDGNSYTNFALDDVITLGSVSGSAKYSNSATSLRYFQWTEKGYGSLIFKAKAGYVITSIKLKYTQAKAGTVPCVYWWSKNFRVPACDVLSSNVARDFYSNQVVIFLGNTDTSTDNGEIQVSEYTVTYEQVTLDRKYTKAMTDLVMQYNWGTGTTPLDALTDNTVQLNNVLSLKEEKTGNLRYWENNRALTCYQNSGSITFKAREGATIKNMRVIYYASSATDAVGVLVRASDWGTNGRSIPAAKQIASNAVIPVNSNSISLKAGNIYSGSAQTSIMITGVQIEYTDGNSQMETYANLTDVSSSSEKKYTGDNGYKWKVKNFAHRDTSAMYDHLGIHLFYNGYIATDGPIEGGIKDVSFEWRLASASSRPISEPTKFTVKAGSQTETCTDAGGSYRMAGHHMNYTHAFNLKSNAAFSINVGAKESTAQAQPIFGPVTITPYLLYTKKSVTIKAKDYASQNFKYTNTALINNTAGEGTISYAVSGENANKIASINSSTGEVTIIGAGTVTITASWEGVTTTYSLTIQLETPSISFAESEVTKMVSAGSHKQTLTFTTPSSGTGIYSIVSGPASGTIDDDGTVHFTEAGDYVIKGKFNTLPYKPDSTTYTLKVTELIVPALKFDTSYVEKPVGAAAFTNAFSKPEDHTGAVTYSSSETGVATVEENGDGTVTIVGAGTTTITASVAETSIYAAGNKSYSLKVFPLSDISFADKEKSVYLNADPFTYAVTKTAGDGEITYSSSNTDIAGVDNNGLVTLTGTASGSVTITAIIAKTENYWADTATYTLNVSSLKLPTASFIEGTVNKVQGFEAFTNTSLTTTSDGVKTYESSDTRVATVNETTGEVTKGEKPGQTVIKVKIAASDTWEKIEAQYTLNVSSAPIEDMATVSKTVGEIKGTATWANESMHPNTPINNVITLSNGKFYNNSEGGEFRYYYQEKQYATSQFTLQAKAGVIIKSVKFTYTANDNTVLTDEYCYGSNVPAGHEFYNGVSHAVDANAITFYVGKTSGSSAGTLTLKAFEITYFDPSEGVAVTKMVNDLGKSEGLDNDHSYKNIAVNQAISLCTNDDGNLKYYTSGVLNCYRHKGAIEIKARPGATIHHVKITYTATEGCLLTKYKGTGFSILPVDQIASDSILYVNANSIKLDVGTSQSSVTGWPSISITKIYVNYTDNSEVVVDNFNNCTSEGSTDTIAVPGVDGKFNWKFTNFSRKDTITNRMYYDQSVLINKGGKIFTPISGALKEVAFDWHPTEANKEVKFYVKAGGETITVDSTMASAYTINFKKANIQNYDTFAIEVDANSATTLEIGHISLTPYILYTNKEVEIAAKDYKEAGWKYTNESLINYTGKTIEYTTSDASIASIDATTGEVTIQTGGTVTISATADGVTTSYSLTINLEETSAEFATKAPVLLLSAGSYKQKLNITTEATEGNVVNYTFVGDHEGATLSDSTVTFTQTGTFTIKGRLEQNLPYAAAEDTYVLTVNNAPSPEISFAVDSLAKDINDDDFINPLTAPEGVGAATYSSSNTDVATVVNNGTVTIVGSGKTTIKVVVAESASYAADSASYILNVLPLPEMSFAEENIIAYLNTQPFTNALTISEGAGAVKYTSTDELVAMVDETSGEVSIIGDGEVTITANSAKSQKYSAGTKSYALTVIKKILPDLSFTNAAVTKVHTDEPFTNVLKQSQNPKSTGEVTYTSTDEQVATMSDSTVTLHGKTGVVTITAHMAAKGNFEEASATFKLTVNPAPTPGGETVNGNIATIAANGKWSDNQYRTYFKIDDKISVSSAANNAKYNKSEESVCYFQNTNKGQFTIRAKAGVIIQSVKFTYTATNNGVITNNYGTDGKSIAAGNQFQSGKTYKFDANRLNFYVGSTAAKTNGEVHIKGIEVRYFDPKTGVEVTRTAKDLGRQCGLKNNTEYKDIAVNNVISLHADQGGTLKYYTTGSLNCYRWTGPIYINAREGATIHYVKITYGGGPRATLTKFYGTDGKNIPASDRIASDSILYVNANSLKLYVGDTLRDNTTSPTLSITKVYVVYTDSTASVDNFNNCTAIYGGAQPTTVEGVGLYDWKITEFNRDSLRRIGYDQSIMLRQNGGKIETVGTEGGVKEVAFDWCASDSAKSAKFAVKVGAETIATIDSAKTGGWKPMTYTATGIKKNGAFSIEVDQTSGSQVEFAHISLTPYLLYTTKEADVELGNTYQMTPQIDNRDNETAITYTITSGEGEITADGTVTPTYPGDLTIQAAWDGITTTYTLHVSGTLTLNDYEDNSAKITKNAGKSMDVTIKRAFQANTYNTICLPFNTDKEALATALGREITSLAKYNQSATLDGEKKNLDVEIKEVEDDEDMPAGTPYLLQFSGENITEGISFSGVEIVNTTGLEVGQGGTTQFIGTINPYMVSKDAKSVLFVVAGNKLAWNATGVDKPMKGFRAYFNVPGMTNQSGVAPRLVFRQPSTPTGIDNHNDNDNHNRKMIIDNQLVIIRNGVRYNANGQLLKW